MHANAKLTPLARSLMVGQILAGSLSQRAAAAARCVSEKTVRRWVARAKADGLTPRLEDRSSAPHHQPRKTSAQIEEQILLLRRQRRTYAQILMVVRTSKATVSRILQRHHLNRLSSLEPPKPPPIRYEREHPGDLLHLDIKKLGRFERPGVRATGDRTQRNPANYSATIPKEVRATGDRTQRNPGAGVESLHVAIDDHSRLAFACLLPNEKTPSVLHALHQAIDFYQQHGIPIRRILCFALLTPSGQPGAGCLAALGSDRGSTYRSHLFAAACAQLGIRHLFTKPYRPQTNGKAERFIQTITREWAYSRPYNSSLQRASFLPAYLHDYNFHRPHSALHSLPPSSRLPPTADNLLRINS